MRIMLFMDEFQITKIKMFIADLHQRTWSVDFFRESLLYHSWLMKTKTKNFS